MGIGKLEAARKVYETEVDDMTRQFWELHFVPMALHDIFTDLLDELRESEKSKALRMRIRDQIEKTDRIGYPYYILSIFNVAKAHTTLGEWMEAKLFLEDVLKHTESTQRSEVKLIKKPCFNIVETGAME
jgi:hypothetical protein